MDRHPSAAWIALHFVLAFAMMAAAFFLPAGTIFWPEAWCYIVLQMTASGIMTVWLARNDPALLRSRMTLFKPAARGWDRLFMVLVTMLTVPFLLLPGLDAVRYHWSSVPIWLELAGFAGVGWALWLIFRVLQENSFASPLVEVQPERGHRVIESGPYAYVRHPMYSGFIILVFSLPLALGSYWTLLLGVLLAISFIVRIFPEERVLHDELEGYGGYARRVPYRLIPRLW